MQQKQTALVHVRKRLFRRKTSLDLQTGRPESRKGNISIQGKINLNHKNGNNNKIQQTTIYLQKLSELTYDSNTIVQKYIEKPLLIGGYKFDLRLYVLIPSYYPVTIYMYREGLARFGTDKFTLNDLRNPFRHLTNSSINKLGPGYTEMKDRIGSGTYLILT